MEFIIGLFRFILVVDCIFLILLVLIQLPKKEAGLGVAFGGAATDALFGAGAGNAITKITKWTAACFFVLSLGLATADSHYARMERNATSKEMMVLPTEDSKAEAATLNKTLSIPAKEPESADSTAAGSVAEASPSSTEEAATATNAPAEIPTEKK